VGATVDRIKVWITVTPEFARDWYPSLLWNWLNWRDEERAAGRGFHIQYAVSMENQKLTRDELENFPPILALYRHRRYHAGRYGWHHGSDEDLVQWRVHQTWVLGEGCSLVRQMKVN
jgi:hypothetical protein